VASNSQAVQVELIVTFTSVAAQDLLNEPETCITLINIWDILVLVGAAV